MLRVYPKIDKDSKPIGCTEPYLRSPKQAFDYYHKQEWFDDPNVEQMIRDIDKTEHVKGGVFESPVLGIIPAQKLSGGVKGLILAYKSFDLPRVYSASFWGGNCVEWLRWLSFKVNFGIYYEYCLPIVGDTEIMAQKYTTSDWSCRDFKTCSEVMTYYLENREVHEYEEYIY